MGGKQALKNIQIEKVGLFQNFVTIHNSCYPRYISLLPFLVTFSSLTTYIEQQERQCYCCPLPPHQHHRHDHCHHNHHHSDHHHHHDYHQSTYIEQQERQRCCCRLPQSLKHGTSRDLDKKQKCKSESDLDSKESFKM